jgi:gamma-glutamyltranspeptidase/glutathione hydrolase
MSERGVVAAGHPVTAEAGARALREGGNAVDAAIAAVLMSFVTESPLTGFGAGGFMLVHDPGREDVLIDFFVAAGGSEGVERGAELVPIPVHFDERTVQVFHVGAASCGVPGNPAGLDDAARRFGSMPLPELARDAIAAGREGVEVNELQGYLFEILAPILTSTPESEALYAPEGRILHEGETFRYPEMADALERFAAEGAEPFYRGEVARAVADWVQERGGTLGFEDMSAYEAIEREPIRIPFRGAEVLTNPPPSSGGILIAYALGLLERFGERSDLERVVAAMAAANGERGEGFDRGLHDPGYVEGFLDPARLDSVAERIAGGRPLGGNVFGLGDQLGSTTHIAALDGAGMCATATCSNGTSSGILVPGTGVHVNNMLGEEDLNPGGFHSIPPGRRVSSMMSPSVVLREGEIGLGLGSAGSNRIRSAILQVILRTLEDGMEAGDAVRAPRIHFESGTVQAEPGVDPSALDRLEERGVPVVRWSRQNLFFGGCQAVARAGTSELSGGGDPRRGGAVAHA